VQLPSSTATTSAVGARSLRFATAAVLILAVALLLRPGLHRDPSLPGSLGVLPMRIGDWSATNAMSDKETLALLGPGEFLIRDYKNVSEPQPGIGLFIEYFPTRAGEAIDSLEKRSPSHGPWSSTPREVVQITHSDGTSLLVNRVMKSRFRGRILELYWFQVHGRALASEGWAKYYLLYDSIRMNRSDGALVRLTTPMLDGESPDAAQVRMMKLGSQLLPMIDRCIPR